jgi:hypothetical protein
MFDFVSKTTSRRLLDTEFCLAAVWRRVSGRPPPRGSSTSRISARFVASRFWDATPIDATREPAQGGPGKL